MTRAVIDPGVLISGVISPRGAPAGLIRAWRSGEFDLVVCPRLLEELRRSLAYPKVARYITEKDAARLIDALARAALVVANPDDVPRICRDPNDDYLFALAGAAADVLVSGDRDVLEVEQPGVRVFTPANFSELLRTRWN